MPSSEKPDCKALFGRRLRELRLAQYLSQEEVAFAAGMDRTYVSGCERGRRNIGIENICKLAEALRVKPEHLLKDMKAWPGGT